MGNQGKKNAHVYRSCKRDADARGADIGSTCCWRCLRGAKVEARVFDGPVASEEAAEADYALAPRLCVDAWVPEDLLAVIVGVLVAVGDGVAELEHSVARAVGTPLSF